MTVLELSAMSAGEPVWRVSKRSGRQSPFRSTKAFELGIEIMSVVFGTLQFAS